MKIYFKVPKVEVLVLQDGTLYNNVSLSAKLLINNVKSYAVKRTIFDSELMYRRSQKKLYLIKIVLKYST